MDKPNGEVFFFYFALAAFFVVVFSFGLHAIIRADHLPPVTAPLVIHAVFMFGWNGLFAAQAGLVRSDNVSLHMRLGRISILLASGVFVSGLLVMASNYERKAEPLVAMSNVMAMVSFAGLYLTALANRKRPDSHKRLIVFASILMFAPAFTRFVRAFDLGEGIILPLWVLTAASVIVYDLKRLRKVHAATIAGCVTFVLAVVVMITVGTSAAWKAFLDSVLR
ncbi:MAG: hypothetical protein IPM63_09115 [Acidobacteriota bacterium]|nr:MAG: hypothetical protein IPM63_09115 [Acidobacteriota bacterium]